MKTLKNISKTIALLAIVFGCSNNLVVSQEKEREQLNKLKIEIEQIVAKGKCTKNNQCDFIAFGSKPCGGPWSYLIYSKSVDVKLLKEKVALYNSKENSYNIKFGIGSDCMMVTPPSKIECANGVCTKIK